MINTRRNCLNNAKVYAIGGSNNNYHLDNKKSVTFKVGGIYRFKVDFEDGDGKFTIRYKENKDKNDW